MKRFAAAFLFLTVLAAPAMALEQLTDIAPLLARPSLSFASAARWEAETSRPDLYAIGTIKTAGMSGEEALVIAQRGPGARSSRRASRPTGALRQTVPAEAFAGQRVRLTARLKTQQAVLVQMTLRAGGPGGSQLGYDMPIRGTNDWQSYEIVMDVPAEATGLSYGVLLGGGNKLFLPSDGQGVVWADSFKLEAVDRKVPVTRNYLAAGYQAASYFNPNGYRDPVGSYFEGAHTSVQAREAVTAYDHRTNQQMNANNGPR